MTNEANETLGVPAERLTEIAAWLGGDATVRSPTWDEFRAMASELVAARSQLDALTAERDEARNHATTLLRTAQEDLVLMKETAATVTSLRERAEAAEAQLARQGEALKAHRDCFAEITAKATPCQYDPNDPERITAYVIPAGPLHRAAGKIEGQMFDGETHLKAAAERVAELETAFSNYVKDMNDNVIPDIVRAIRARSALGDLHDQ